MNIVYSNHAEKRLRQRGITPLEVEFIIKHPDYTKKSFEGRKEAIGNIRGRSIKVVFTEKENYIKVITVI